MPEDHFEPRPLFDLFGELVEPGELPVPTTPVYFGCANGEDQCVPITSEDQPKLFNDDERE